MTSQILSYLEEESIYIIREAYASFENLGMLYSIGKDSSVLYHLCKKAFLPNKVPFPLLHIDTTWKFKEMLAFRDTVIYADNISIYIYSNPELSTRNITPFNTPIDEYTYLAKTKALIQALEYYKFNSVLCGARRDEEKSRAKERIFSIRTNNLWDPQNQRPELWNTFNTHLSHDQSVRVFPLSNWTELDIWGYIKEENINIVPLYFSKLRPVIEKQNTLIVVDDIDALPDKYKNNIFLQHVRFRTLGCWPLSGAIKSTATTITDIIKELEISNYTERQGRLIDTDQPYSMERKKIEGYF